MSVPYGSGTPYSMSKLYRSGSYVTKANTKGESGLIPSSGTISFSNFMGSTKYEYILEQNTAPGATVFCSSAAPQSGGSDIWVTGVNYITRINQAGDIGMQANTFGYPVIGIDMDNQSPLCYYYFNNTEVIALASHRVISTSQSSIVVTRYYSANTLIYDSNEITNSTSTKFHVPKVISANTIPTTGSVFGTGNGELYIGAGYIQTTPSYTSHAGEMIPMIIRLNRTMTAIDWSKTFDLSQQHNLAVNAIKPDGLGNLYIALGVGGSANINPPGSFLMKLNATTGAIIWSVTISTALYLYDLGFNYNKTAIFVNGAKSIYKFDTSGNLVWAKEFNFNPGNYLFRRWGMDVSADRTGFVDDSIYFGGSLYLTTGSTPTDYVGFYCKIDTNGNMIWNRTISSDNGAVDISSIKRINNDDLILVGNHFISISNTTGIMLRLPSGNVGPTGVYSTANGSYTISNASYTFTTITPTITANTPGDYASAPSLLLNSFTTSRGSYGSTLISTVTDFNG